MGNGDRAPGKSQFLCSLDTFLNTGVSQWVRPPNRPKRGLVCLSGGNSCESHCSPVFTLAAEFLPIAAVKCSLQFFQHLKNQPHYITLETPAPTSRHPLFKLLRFQS